MGKVVKPPGLKASGKINKKKFFVTHGKKNKPKTDANNKSPNTKISLKAEGSENKEISQNTSNIPKKNMGKNFKKGKWNGKNDAKVKEEVTVKEEVQDNTINSTTPDTPKVVINGEAEDNYKFLKSEPKRSHCIEFEGKWSDELPKISKTESTSTPTYLIPKIKKYADSLFGLEEENYERQSSKTKGENMWMKQVMKIGTIQDKISTYIVQIQTSPVHCVKILEKLIAMITLKCRRTCFLAMDALKNIFISDLLVEDKKLTPFDKQPFHDLLKLSRGNNEARDKILLIWMFEHKIKSLYSRFLGALAEINKDVLEKTKSRVMFMEQKLLMSNPESEQILLERIVNRLGEPIRSLAAKAMFHLKDIIKAFPAMQGVVVKEVERLLYRQNISEKAKYYGICFLSQIMFDHDSNEDVAGRLIIIYFSFFNLSVKKGEVDSKIMSSLLTGVNRAFPFSAMDDKQIEEQVETIYKLVYLVGFNISIQALTLLFQILGSKQGLTDRYYNALYGKILNPELESSSKQVVLFNLLFNSMKRDTSVERIRSFIKRMLQACEYLQPNCAAGIMFIVSEVLKARKDVNIVLKVSPVQSSTTDLSRFDYSDDDDDEHFDDIKEEETDQQIKDNVEENDVESKDGKSFKPGFIFRKKCENKPKVSGYDPLQRNPLYAAADKTAYWELSSLLRHFHPSIVLFAKHLYQNEPINYAGDPISDFTLLKFLERFSFKNPKKPKERINDPTYPKKKVYKEGHIKTLQPGSSLYMEKTLDKMPEDEMFLYNFFLEKKKRKGKENVDEKDDDSINSEIVDDYFDRMMGVDFAEGLREGDKKGGFDSEEGSEDEGGEDEEIGSESGDSEPEFDEDDFGFKDLSSGEESDEDKHRELREEDIDFSNDDDDDEPPKKKSKNEVSKKGVSKKEVSKKEVKKKGVSKKKAFSNKTKYDLDNYTADAESFGEVLESNKESGLGNSYVTSGKVSLKQIKWEKKQEDYMRGRDHWRGGKYKKINRFKKGGKKKAGK